MAGGRQQASVAHSVQLDTHLGICSRKMIGCRWINGCSAYDRDNTHGSKVESRFHLLTCCCCNIYQLMSHLGSIPTLSSDLAMLLTIKVNMHFKVYSYTGPFACTHRENK